MERYQSTPAIVIKIKTYKESDLLVTLLTPRLGKITALAKGAKNIKSSRLGSLQLGNLIKVHLYYKNDRLWLSESITTTQFLKDKKNLTQLNLLFYFLEIINNLVADNQHLEGIYPSAENLIKAINNNQLYDFIDHEIKFIKLIGFGIPSDIVITFNQKNYAKCQQLIKNHLESIIEKPLESSKLFQ